MIQNLSLNTLLIEKSKYHFFQPTSWNPDFYKSQMSLGMSLTRQGIISPLLVHIDKNKAIHLVSGFSRAAYSLKYNLNTVPCIVLPIDYPVLDIMQIICSEYFEEITINAISKSRYINLAKRLEIEKAKIITNIFPLLGIEQQETLFSNYSSIIELPEIALKFCHEKNFSLRQCLNIARHPKALVEWIFNKKNDLNLSASLLEEILNNLTDYMKFNAILVADLISSSEINNIFNPQNSTQIKTAKLRAFAHDRKYPILSNTTKKMMDIRKNVKLPHGCDLRWDTTLEIKELTLTINISKTSELNSTLSSLSKPEINSTISSLFECI